MVKKVIVNTENPNGIEVDITAEEETLRVSTAEESATQRQAETDAEAQKATDKASAKAKLMAGEALTEAEADTIVLQII